MSSLPLLSIVIPSLNGERTIGHTLRSLIAQTERNFEIVVVDDGSTDATAAIARAFPGVVLVSHATPRGVSASRNDGAAVASSAWLCFLDDDDWFPATFVADAVARLEPGVALCYDSVVVTAEGGDEARATVGASVFATSTFAPRRVDRASLHRCFDEMPMLKSIVERTAFDRVDGFDARYMVGEDFHFHIKLLVAGYDLNLSDEPCGFYRRRFDSVTARTLRSGVGLRVAAAHRWIQMATDMLRELDLPPLARVAVRTFLLDRWRYRLAMSTVRSIAGGDRTPLDARLLRHLPGAFDYAVRMQWPEAIAARVRVAPQTKRAAALRPA